MDLVLLPCLFGARPAGAVAADPGAGKIRVDPRFSAAAGAVPGGGFAVVREGV
ncbi:hypothetical protein [Arthrobacter crystallopoietes]|uniref:hypothetical protein n=1 Tax=Crystallibacter crystallopoietes TaxID=37928 RepID=UPI0013052B08|nr:hypothetical protein [Arthrobacter crystallopoietes]